MSPLLWTCKSTRNLADALTGMGHEVSHQTVGRLLDELGYSLQANRKTEEGKDHPDRNAQFEHINARVQAALDDFFDDAPALLTDVANAFLDYEARVDLAMRVHKTPKFGRLGD